MNVYKARYPRHTDDVYVEAWRIWCDQGSYTAVAKQLGVSKHTAKRWVLTGRRLEIRSRI